MFQWWAVERARAYSKYEAILKKFNATKSLCEWGGSAHGTSTTKPLSSPNAVASNPAALTTAHAAVDWISLRVLYWGDPCWP